MPESRVFFIFFKVTFRGSYLRVLGSSLVRSWTLLTYVVRAHVTAVRGVMSFGEASWQKISEERWVEGAM